RQMRAPMERQSRAMQEFVNVSGLRRVADGFTNIGRAGLAAFSSLTRLVPVMGALTGAASIAGLARLVSTWSQFGANLQRDASRIGTSTQELERLRNAIVLGGGSADTMVQSLKDLTDASARAFADPGHNAQTFAQFQRAGISLEGLNGQLRSSTELMPEVLQYIDSFKNPTDRMRVATDLGGQSLYDLTQQLRQAERPGETLIETWRRLNQQAGQCASLTDAQKAGLQRYREAVGGLTVAFSELSKGIGTTLAIALTPLINKFSEWVRTNQPEIQRAVDDLATAFGQWLEGVNVDQLLADLSEIGRIIGQLVRAVGELIKVWERLHGTYRVTAADILAGSPLAAGLSQEEKTRILAEATPAGEAPPPAPRPSLYERLGLPRLGPAPVGAAPPRVAPAVPYTPTTLTSAVGVTPQHYQGFREAIAGIESGGRYSLKGGAGDKYSGRYQFGPAEIANTARALGEPPPSREQFLADPAMQERYFEAYTMGHHNFLMQRSAKYRDAPAQEKLAILGYAHNQGEGGAARWLETNVAQADAFGTAGTRYSEAIRRNLAAVDRMTAANDNITQASLRGDVAQRTGEYGTPQQAAQQLATVRSSTGQTWRVHQNAADQFQGLVNDLEERGYDIAESGGGYNPRMKRGGGAGWSSHAYGTAIDINPSRLPQGRAANDLPADIGQIAAARGLRWGGAEGFGVPDPQHFEVGRTEGAPAQVTGGAPVSGSVDVTVTHKNPPAGVTMTASAEGEGINLAPPRTEQQQLNAA
ncbi:MAG TPA: M15 family metallopeptidase, partial [Xanthobacteraceae bacterium]|nr:M15 family metallopeptidase [Xanthobacteraceae bacterium]